jgi:hypothetical protein
MSMKWYAEENTRKKFNNIKLETAEEFLARGGVSQKVGTRQSFGSKKKAIDAQKLLDAAAGTSSEAEVIKFLRSQGIQVEGL